MDDAAFRVNPTDLARLARLRARREDEAARKLCTLTVEREAADTARAQAARCVAERETGRIAGERAIYAKLGASGPIGLAALEESRVAVGRLGEALEQAKQAEAERSRDATAAEAAHAAGRAEHALRARATRRWDRAQQHILSARRAVVDRGEEIETEDEILMRAGAAQAHR